jgi:fucose 4-O-acetylase-like acetyltransferase
LLVVFGHALRGLFGAALMSPTGFWGRVDTFIYAFHMPLFFFLSGLFFTATHGASWGAFAKRQVVRLGYPYLLWASVQMLIQGAFARQANHAISGAHLWTILYAPPMQFWFLYALLCQSLLLGWLDKLGLDRGLAFSLALAAALTGPFVPLGPWGVPYQVREFLPYFTLGAFLGVGCTGALLARTRVLLARGPARFDHRPLFALAGFAAIGAAMRQGWLQEHATAQLFSLAGAAAALCLAGWFAAARSRSGLRASTARVLAVCGRRSLPIYVLHTIVSAGTRIGLQRVLRLESPWLHLALGTGLGVLVPLALAGWAERARIPYLFAWPSAVRRPHAGKGRLSYPAPAT